MLSAVNLPPLSANCPRRDLTHRKIAANSRYLGFVSDGALHLKFWRVKPYTIRTAQTITMVIYSFLLPWGVFPSERTKQVSTIPRYSHSKAILRTFPGAKPNAGSAKPTVKILKIRKKLPYAD